MEPMGKKEILKQKILCEVKNKAQKRLKPGWRWKDTIQYSVFRYYLDMEDAAIIDELLEEMIKDGVFERRPGESPRDLFLTEAGYNAVLKQIC